MLSREEAIKHLFQPATSQPHLKDRRAVIQAAGGQERVTTYTDFERLIAIAAKKLSESDVQPGDRVILVSENSAELAATIVACFAVKAMAVPVDLRITPQELGNIVKQLGAKVLAASSNIMPEFDTKAKALAGDAALIDLAKLSKTEGELPPVKADFVPGQMGHPAFIILTSGTTGMPKGAVHTLDSLLISLIELGDMAGINDTMRGVLPLPLSHIFGMEVFFTAFIRGMIIVFSELTPASFVQAVAKHKPHIIAGVPTLYGALLAAPKDALDLSNGVLLLSGGAPLPISLADEFEKKFGKRINNGYGSTESKIVALNQRGPIESVGQIVPSVKIDIVNDKDEVLSEGDVGEIRITGPILMQGYLNMAEATQKVLRNGHYYTGDMGYFKEGNLYIAGRSKEMVIVAGYKVFPVEVEDALRKHPLVKEVAVLGQPHRQLGQIVKAVVVINEGDLSTKLEGEAESKKDARQQLLGELKEYCKGNLRRELRPMEWEFQPASKPLPKTGTGKVDKKQLEMAAV